MPPELTPDANDQIVDPPVSQDEMDEFIKSLEGDFDYAPNIDLSTLAPQGSVVDPEPGPDDDETPDDDDEVPPEGEPAPTGDDVESVTVNGQQIARADIERLYAFDQYLRANPDAAQRVAAALPPPTGESAVPTTTAPAREVAEFVPPTPPEDLDLEDPAVKFMWDQLVDTRKEAWDTRQQLAQNTATFQQTQQQVATQRANEDMAVALNQFKTQFPNLNDDDMAIIRNEAGALVDTYLAQLPPVEALRRSMEVAAWANADMRVKLEDPTKTTPTAEHKSTRRKQRLGSISGSPRSAPKVDARPQYTSDREMVNEFAQALNDAGLGR